VVSGAVTNLNELYFWVQPLRHQNNNNNSK